MPTVKAGAFFPHDRKMIPLAAHCHRQSRSDGSTGRLGRGFSAFMRFFPEPTTSAHLPQQRGMSAQGFAKISASLVMCVAAADICPCVYPRHVLGLPTGQRPFLAGPALVQARSGRNIREELGGADARRDQRTVDYGAQRRSLHCPPSARICRKW